MIKAIIFDMDGVLVDSEPHHTIIEKKLFNHLGIEVSEEEHSRFMGTPSVKMWETIIETKNLNLSVDDINSKYDNDVESYFGSIGNMKPEPGLTELLGRLKNRGLLLAVASSSTKNIIEIILQKTGLKNYFNAIVSGSEVEHGKPAPDIFLHTAALLNVKPRECVVVEDSPNGVKAAKAAGMYCVAYTATGNKKPEIADTDIDHFGNLINVIPE